MSIRAEFFPYKMSIVEPIIAHIGLNANITFTLYIEPRISFVVRHINIIGCDKAVSLNPSKVNTLKRYRFDPKQPSPQFDMEAYVRLLNDAEDKNSQGAINKRTHFDDYFRRNAIICIDISNGLKRTKHMRIFQGGK